MHAGGSSGPLFKLTPLAEPDPIVSHGHSKADAIRIRRLWAQGVTVRRVALPEGHDPNSFFVQGGDAHRNRTEPISREYTRTGSSVQTEHAS
jgi:hypothetical protein